MKILHVSAGWQENNGAAVIARLIAGEQEQIGNEVRYSSNPSLRDIGWANEVWTHCGWSPKLWLANLFSARLVRMPEACYDPVRLSFHGWKKRLVTPLERFFLRRAAKVVVTCRAEADWVKRYEPQANTELTDIRRFFNIDRMQAPKPCAMPIKLLYLGRKHPLKGVELLERAIDEVGRDKFVLRIESTLGGREKELAWEWCDALVLPTLTENFGLVIAEALERGKTVITTDGAPAWEDERELRANGRLVYIDGFREANDIRRVTLLQDALRKFVV